MLSAKVYFSILILIQATILGVYFYYGDDHTESSKKQDSLLNSCKSLYNQNPSLFVSQNAQKTDTSSQQTQQKKSKYNYVKKEVHKQPKKQQATTEEQNPNFKKIDLKQNFFKQLNLYQPLDMKYFNDDPNTQPDYDVPNMGLINRPKYCENVDQFNLNHKSNILDSWNFITDYNTDGLARQLVMQKYGRDLLPASVSKDMSKEDWNSRLYDIPKEGTMIFTKKVKFHYYHEFERNLFCKFQQYNHIPGHGTLTRKDLNVESVNNYGRIMKSKPECFNQNKFFPKSFRLNDALECKEFFQYINSEEYVELRKTEPIPFISKISYGSARANGLEILNIPYEQRIRRKYYNGELCGQIVDNIMMQQYISNPLMIYGRKFDFRIYMMVASTKPLIMFYHDGFLRISLLKYEKNSQKRQVHFTNTHLSKEIFKHPELYKEELEGITVDQLRDMQMWSMEKLQQYLFDIGKIQDLNWLDTYLRPAFKKAFTHLVMMTQHSYLKSSNVFEVFGLDFLLDEHLNLWFIECNASPVFQGTSPEKEIFQTTLLRDAYEIQYSYLRSRYTRVSSIYEKIKENKNEKQDIKKLAQLVEEANVNRLEPEFAIRQNNTFVKIIDFNERKPFGDFFDQKCFSDIATS